MPWTPTTLDWSNLRRQTATEPEENDSIPDRPTSPALTHNHRTIKRWMPQHLVIIHQKKFPAQPTIRMRVHLRIALAHPILMTVSNSKSIKPGATPQSTQGLVCLQDRPHDGASTPAARPVCGIIHFFSAAYERRIRLLANAQTGKSTKITPNGLSAWRIQRQPSHEACLNCPAPSTHSHWPASDESVQRRKISDTTRDIRAQRMEMKIGQVHRDDNGDRTSNSDASAHL